LLIWFGLRPATRSLLEPAAPLPALASASVSAPILAALPSSAPGESSLIEQVKEQEDNFLSELTRKAGNVPAQRLEKIIDLDESQAAAILKQWMKAS
jgi:flagellar M-ring protein FliF